MPRWKTTDSLALYNIEDWGRDLFTVNEAGHVTATPDGPKGGAIDIYELTRELVERGIEAPILLRFTGIVRQRIELLNTCFDNAFFEHEYTGAYRGVYPIKVNQQRHLVEDMVRFCRPHHMGLEAGSKPELLICLALLDDPEALIICNGYKDSEYIETAMLATKLGRNTVIVIEKLSELDHIITVARKLQITPILGVRAKLTAPGMGRWRMSSGDAAKFGLTARDIVLLIDRLREEGMLDALRLLHFHIGSQVTAIRTFKDALSEATRTYTELVRMGAKMGIFDVGGGLGVDYDGSRTNFESSMNYSEQEYASDIVHALANACESAEVPHPDIVTECGRAMVAHHAVLVFNVLGVETMPTDGPPLDVADEAPDVVAQMRDVYDTMTLRNYQEAWHDAQHLREEGMMGYRLGLLRLEDRARMERLFWQVCGRIRLFAAKDTYVPDDLDGLERKLADSYYCNFSVFQSIPDAWAVDQLFPIVPLHRLDEQPTRRGTLADLTCDSDGKVGRFIDRRDVKHVLELHPWTGEEYYLGVFLVGAYQEILGDMHNLFGDTNDVLVSLDDKGGYHIDYVLEGETITEVLDYVQYSRKSLVRKVREACEAAIRNDRLSREEAKQLLSAYQSGLDGYTYLKTGSR